MKDMEAKIPAQQEGTEVNVEDRVTLHDKAEAIEFFNLVKQRLLNINDWDEIAGALSAGFKLTDVKGTEISGKPAPGNYFKINIPAPGIVTGEGYDWVRVEEVIEDDATVSIRVRPASSPLNANDDIAHFYTDEATSNFIVRLEGVTVTAGVYGRNEKPNVKADTVIDKVRNAIVGISAVSGFSKLQWKALVSGLLKND